MYLGQVMSNHTNFFKIQKNLSLFVQLRFPKLISNNIFLFFSSKKCPQSYFDYLSIGLTTFLILFIFQIFIFFFFNRSNKLLYCRILEFIHMLTNFILSFCYNLFLRLLASFHFHIFQYFYWFLY